MALHFSRDTKVYMVESGSVWEIPVLDGFSFSQATNASEITLNEMADSAGNSRRARQMFNDSYAPAEWSFASYMRPNSATFPAEDALWANFVSNTATWGGATWSSSNTAVSASASSGTWSISMADSNKTTNGTFDLYFVMGAAQAASASYSASTTTTIYKIEGCVANEASIDFEIDGIATINWSGFGKIIQEVPAFDATNVVDRQTGLTSNFIRNRLTSLTATVDADADGSSKTYDITLTGGNITMNNNITFLTPETLGVVNQPLGHVTGTRNIGGNFTCYLDSSASSSVELFEDLIEATSTITNTANLVFSVGGSNDPKVVVTLPNCHLEVPTHSIEDVISLETTFHALPTDIDSADEATIQYSG
jgi:hypothetical protein